MDIGFKIKELRMERGLTQEELADRAELSKGFISQVENNLTSPSIATLTDILQCLGTDLKDFFNDIYKKHHDDTIFITIHGMLFIILHGIMLNYKTSELTKINKYVVRGCSLSEVEYDGKEFKIKYIGDDSHLKSSEIITYK